MNVINQIFLSIIRLCTKKANTHRKKEKKKFCFKIYVRSQLNRHFLIYKNIA